MNSKFRRISFIVHTRNEERNIEDCLLSVKAVVDEMIMVDMSSEDKTVDIAKKLGVRIISIPNKGFVDDCRNFGISKAKFNWILCLDADERLTKKLANQIKDIIKDDQYDVVTFPFKNIRLGKWMQHSGWWPDYHPRLFKKGFVKWPLNVNRAHTEQIIKGKVLILDPKEENAIIHFNVADIKSFLDKLINYCLLEGSGDDFKNKDITPTNVVNYYSDEFKNRYIEQKGYLDGMHGFVFSKFREYIKFIEFANWWERNGYPELFNHRQLSRTILEKEELEGIETFKSSKFYKIWQFYCKFRDLLKKCIE